MSYAQAHVAASGCRPHSSCNALQRYAAAHGSFALPSAPNRMSRGSRRKAAWRSSALGHSSSCPLRKVIHAGTVSSLPQSHSNRRAETDHQLVEPIPAPISRRMSLLTTLHECHTVKSQSRRNKVSVRCRNLDDPLVHAVHPNSSAKPPCLDGPHLKILKPI